MAQTLTGNFDSVSSILLGNAINSIQEDKKQEVDKMFDRLNEDSQKEFNHTLEQKVQNTQTQIDYYSSEMNNSALSEKKREEAREQYNSLLTQQEQLVQQQERYNSMEEPSMVRYTFENKDEYQSFVQDMADRNVYVCTSDAQVNGVYMCEMFQQDSDLAETVANNNEYGMQTANDATVHSYTDEVQQARTMVSVDYMEVSQQDYEKAMRSHEYSEELKDDGSSAYYRTQRIDEESFVANNDGSDRYFATQDENGNTSYYMKNEVSRSEYETWTPSTPDEIAKQAQIDASYQREVDELGREHYYKKLDENDNYDYKKVDPVTGETSYHRFDNSQNYSAERSDADRLNMAGKFDLNTGLGAVDKLSHIGNSATTVYGNVAGGLIGAEVKKELDNTLGGNVGVVVTEVERFVNDISDASKRFAKNGGEMPEEFKVYHRLSKETIDLQTMFTAEAIMGDEEKMAFAKEMTEKYGNVTNAFGSGLVGLTPKQMIDINAEFIRKHGDLVLDAKGRFDFDKLAKMTPAQLKVHGISVKEREFIVQANKALSLNGQIDSVNMQKLIGEPISGVIKGLSSLGVTDDMEDGLSEVKQAKQNLDKARDTSKKIIEKTKDVKRIVRERRELKAVKNADRLKQRATKAGKKATKQAGKKATKKTVSDKLKEQSASKYKQMMVEKLSEKFVFLQRLQEIKMQAMAKLGQTALGTAVKTAMDAVVGFLTGTFFVCVGIACGIFALLCSGIVLIIIIYTGITSLFDVYTGQSVAQTLAEKLTDEEDAWFEQLLDVDNLWAKREEYKYDHFYRDYNVYVGASDDSSVGTMVNSLYYKTSTDTFWICPWTCSVWLDSKYCKDVTAEGFALDGVNNTLDGVGGGGYAFELDTNYNLSREVTWSPTGEATVTLDGGYGLPKSGHTSNIKDIIAMADVMFQFDQNSNDDGQLQSLTGSQWDMDWTNFKTNCIGAVKWVSASISKFFGDDSKFIEYENWAGHSGTTSFHALSAYCIGLFEASHQEKIFWEVVFLPIKGTSVVYDASGNPIDNYVRYAEGTNSQIGSYEEIGVDLNGKRAEYCPASEYNSDVTSDAHWGCMTAQLEMYVNKNSSGSITYKGLGVQSSNGSLYSYLDVCKSNTPHLDSTQTHGICLSGISNYSSTGTGITANSAFLSVVQNSECWELTEETANYGGYCAVWSGGYSHYSSVTGTMGGYQSGGIANTSNANGDCYKFAMTVGDESESNVLSFIWYDWEHTGTLGHCHCGGGHCHCSTCHCDDDDDDCNCDAWEDCDNCRNGAWTYTCTKRVYTHNCQGHSCHLCGGHLMANIHGMVYSMTDEQWFCFSGEGAGENYEIVGKILEENLGSKTSFQSYNRTGRNTNETWLDGINLNDGFTITTWQAHNQFMANRLALSQDIFDIDLAIWYGYQQFPIRTYAEYEGWTQENMQMACAKASADWSDYYKFDIPTNISEQSASLSESDIQRLMGWIKWTYQANFGEELDERRVIAVQKALFAVGRGNYSQAHHSHGYYLNPCTINHSGGEGHLCNKTDCSGFASYIYGMANGTTNVYSCQSFMGMTTGQWGSGDGWTDAVKPGDILILNGDESDLGWHAVVYCGYIDLPACADAGLCGLGDADYAYECESGIGKIGQRVPITVDCSPLGNNRGNIYLQNCFTSGSYTMSYLEDLYICPLGDY